MEVCLIRDYLQLTLITLHVKEQFEDEIHPRLRFAHRGLVAMANNGSKNSNDSQFFITLGEGICATLQLKTLTRSQIEQMNYTVNIRCLGG